MNTVFFILRIAWICLAIKKVTETAQVAAVARSNLQGSVDAAKALKKIKFQIYALYLPIYYQH